MGAGGSRMSEDTILVTEAELFEAAVKYTEDYDNTNPSQGDIHAYFQSVGIIREHAVAHKDALLREIRGEPLVVYAFEYCYCRYESSAEVISLHKTKRGAYRAMQKHKWKTWEGFREQERYFQRKDGRLPGSGSEFGWVESWGIRSIEVQD